MTEIEKSIIRNANLEDILDLRVDVIPVSHYNQCATYKDKQIIELKNKIQTLSDRLIKINNQLPAWQRVNLEDL